MTFERPAAVQPSTNRRILMAMSTLVRTSGLDASSPSGTLQRAPSLRRGARGKTTQVALFLSTQVLRHLGRGVGAPRAGAGLWTDQVDCRRQLTLFLASLNKQKTKINLRPSTRHHLSSVFAPIIGSPSDIGSGAQETQSTSRPCKACISTTPGKARSWTATQRTVLKAGSLRPRSLARLSTPLWQRLTSLSFWNYQISAFQSRGLQASTQESPS